MVWRFEIRFTRSLPTRNKYRSGGRKRKAKGKTKLKRANQSHSNKNRNTNATELPCGVRPGRLMFSI